MSHNPPHFLQQRKILIDNLLLRNQHETEAIQTHHPMNPQQHPIPANHSLHNAGGVSNSHNGAGNMHNASHHSNTMHNSNQHYMMDPRHYGNGSGMTSYPVGNMQPVNLMGNVQMSDRQMSQQQLPSNVIDLQQHARSKPMTPTTMPSQIVHQPQQTNLPHQMVLHSNLDNMGSRQLHSNQQPMHETQHPAPQTQQLQHGQLSQNSPVPISSSTTVNQNNQHILNKVVPSPEVAQRNVQNESQHTNTSKEDDMESPHEINNGKKDIEKSVATEDMNTMDVLTMISENDKEKTGDDKVDEMAEKLVIEEESEGSNDEYENDENSRSSTKPFKCNVCPKQFTHKSSLINHVKVHTTDPSVKIKREGRDFPCNQCSKTFPDKWHLSRHLKKHNPDIHLFRCDKCNLDFHVKREYNRHMKIHDGVKTLLCSVCSKTFTDKVKFNRHMRAHEGIKPFQCNVCCESFTQKSNLNIHLRIHDGIRPFQCTVCFICFTNKSDLNRHARIHNGIKPFLCSMCAKCFSRKDDLNRHMKIHEGSKRYVCTMCPKCFTRKDDLNRHLRNHDGLKPFHCTVCFESFTQKALLNIHLRIHTNSKPHACNLCTETFSQLSNLHIHLKVQHGVNPFKCEQCEESFEKETQLSLHMRTSHGAKPFKCNMCEEGFVKKSVLKEHMRISHNVNPFKCDICFKCFTYKNNLRTHIRTHEPISCSACPAIFESKLELQEHMDNSHASLDEDDPDEVDTPKEKSFNCSKCLSVVRIPYEVKVETPFVCNECTGQTVKRERRDSVEKSKNRKSKRKAEFACELCDRSFRYRVPLVKHCKKQHNVNLDVDSESEDSRSVDTTKVKKEAPDDEFSGPLGNFKCALCDKIFVRKATLDRHVSVHGIRAIEHDEIMGQGVARSSEPAGENRNESLNTATSGDETVTDLDINKSDTDNVYIVMPKIETIVKEEMVSDYEGYRDDDDMDNDETFRASASENADNSDDDVPLAKRSFATSEDEGGKKKKNRKAKVPKRRKAKVSARSDADTTDYDETSAVDTDYAESRAGDSGVEGKENGGENRPRRQKRKREEGPFPCEECQKTFNRKTTLKRHLRIHTGIKEFQCWICSKCFMEKSHLMRHMRKHEGAVEKTEVEAPYSCSICDRKFTVKGQLSRHLRAHETEKPDTPQTCEICSKSFDKKAKYKRHMKVHDGVREHQCQVCGNRFKQKSNLNIHMKIHEGIKAHQCEVCSMKFTNKSDLNRHMRKHDGVKPFLCSICAKNFSRKDDLNRHMRKHDGIKPFLCTTCGESFSRKDHLKKHMRKCFGPAVPGEMRQRKRVRKPLPPSDRPAPSFSAMVASHTVLGEAGPRPEPPQYRVPAANGSVATHAHQVLQASVGQAAASGLFWCAAQYYTNPPGLEFGHKPEYYA